MVMVLFLLVVREGEREADLKLDLERRGLCCGGVIAMLCYL